MNVANRKVQLKDPTTYSRKITEMAKEMSDDINDIIETVNLIFNLLYFQPICGLVELVTHT